MPLHAPADLKEKLSRLDRDLPPLKHYDPSSMFAGAQNGDGLNDDERKGACAEAAAFNLLPQRVSTEVSVWGTHFGPISRLPKGDGTELQFPDINAIDQEIIVYWQLRSQEAIHPLLRARYADAVWDLHERITGTRPDVKYARIAIAAYLETIRSKKHTDLFEAMFYSKRALQVALNINDRTEIERAKATMLQLLADSFEHPKAIGVWALGFDFLSQPGHKSLALSDVEQTQLASLLEAILRTCSEPDTPNFSPWAAQAAAQRLAKRYQSRHQGEVKRVVRIAGKAFESLASEAEPLLAMAWLQPVIDEYHGRGMAEDTKRATLLSEEKAKTIKPSFHTAEVATQISVEELETALTAITEGDRNTVLRRIANQFIPRVEEIRDFMKEMKEITPLSSIFPTICVDEERLIAQAGSVDHDPHGRLIMQIAENLNIGSQFLSLAIERAIKTHQLDAEKIAEFLFESPIYDSSRQPTILEALRAYCSGDLVKFVYIAVPQIEHALRWLLGLLGEPTAKPNRQGAMDVKNLNDLLQEPAIIRCFGEDLQLYLLTFLADRRGVNLRNDLCHGLLPVYRITGWLADQVLHVLMTLALVKRAS